MNQTLLTTVLRTAIVVLITLFAHQFALASGGETPAEITAIKTRVGKGFDAIYAFNFDEAVQISSALKDDYPNNAWPYFLEVNYYWWQIVSGNNSEESQNSFELAAQTALSLLPVKNAAEWTNDDLFLLINISACNSRLLAFNEKRLKALMSLNTAVNYLKQSFGQEPNYGAFYLSTGLYNFYILNGAKKHPYLAPYLMLFPRGDAEKSLQYVKKAAESEDMMVNTEAHYFLMKLHLDHNEDYNAALKYNKVIVERYPDNLLYLYYAFRMLIEQDHFEEAKEALKNLSINAKRNKSLNEQQQGHFLELAREDLKSYFLRNPN